MANCMSPQSDVFDIYLSGSDYNIDVVDCNETIVYDLYGQSIYNKKYVQSEIVIEPGVHCLATVYKLRNVSTKNSINLGIACTLTKEQRIEASAGCNLGSSVKLSRTVLIKTTAGVGIGNHTRIQVGNDIEINTAKAGINLGNRCRVRAYEDAYLKDYDVMNLSELYAKGNLQEIYLKEKQ